MPTHARRPSGVASSSYDHSRPHDRPRRPSHSHQRTNTAPDPPTQQRLSSTSTSTPARARAHGGIASARDPPVTLLTTSTPGTSGSSSTTWQPPVDPRARAPMARLHTAATAAAAATMSSGDSSSGSDLGPRSRLADFRAAHTRQSPAAPAARAPPSSGEHAEDVFLNIAADDSASRPRPVEAPARIDRLKSRIARVNSNRQSLPSALLSPSPVHSLASSSTTTTAAAAARMSSTAEPRSAANGNRRASLLPTASRDRHEPAPIYVPGPAPLAPARTRNPPELSHKASFSSRRDADLSPRDFLAQFGHRRSSNPDTLSTPPSRTPVAAYRPSNLHYSSTRHDPGLPRTPHAESALDTASRADGTESHGSTGPPASVWDELDELKTRIRKIELGGKIPATSGAAVTQATADRPRTANTSATTVSSSPKQQRKPNVSPPESSTTTPSTNRTHPLLRDALAKARQHISPTVYRVLEATATEALTLAEMTGSAGPQGTLHSASSILGGSHGSDRQVRRKADNICRSLTELCIAMADNKATLASPAMRASAAAMSRRPSVQINGESPTIRQSIEPESNSLPGISPSRALSRIEARRSGIFSGGPSGSYRESSQDAQEDRQMPSRLQRAGTSLHRSRGSIDEEDEDEPMRAPSRAMTDFRNLRPTDRYSTGRAYTSREPMPDLQPSPALQSTAHLRRPTVTGISNENSLLFREGQRRYDLSRETLHRESSPAYEKQMTGGLRARAQLSVNRNPSNRNSIGGITELGRSVSMGRQRLRGNSTGE